MNEGYIKFTSIQENPSISAPQEIIDEFNSCRSILKNLNLIGQLPNGIGFGNISIRLKNLKKFLITGSNTGYLITLEKKHFAEINRFAIEENKVWYNGATKPSSETMTHAAIYEANTHINAVIHTHHHASWEKYLHQLPTTNTAFEYGTAEIAQDIKKIILKNPEQHSGIIIMGGHEDGIITYGLTLKETAELMIKYTKSN